MITKSSLIGGAALGVLIAASMSAAADAKTSKHHHHATAAAPSSDLESKVDSLTATVGELEQRLNDATNAQQATAQRAQAAEAKADAAEVDAQAARSQLQTQIATIPGEVQSQVAAATPKAKASWIDNTTVGGQVFADLSDVSQGPSPNKLNGYGVDVKRAYLSVDHKFNDIYSADLTVDFAPNGIILSGGTYGTGTLQGSEAIKYAYVQAHYSDALVIQAGAEKSPWIPFVDDVAGYRYIDKHIVDQNKYGNSSDWGVNVNGALAGGLINYSLMGSDGAGYKNPVRSQVMDFEGRVNLNYNGFVLAVGGYDGNISDDVEGGAPYQSVTRFDALAAYTSPQFRIGGEFFQAWDWKTPLGAAAVAAVAATSTTEQCEVSPSTTFVPCVVRTLPVAAIAATPAKQDSSIGYSIFASYNFTPQWSVFGRYDGLNPSQTLDPKERYEYANIGLQYEPVKNVDLALVYKHEDVADAIKGGYGDATTTLAPGSTLTYNTKTGVYTPGSGSSSGTFDEIGIYTQFKF